MVFGTVTTTSIVASRSDAGEAVGLAEPGEFVALPAGRAAGVHLDGADAGLAQVVPDVDQFPAVIEPVCGAGSGPGCSLAAG